jgi:hypothetical protein
MIHNLDIFGTWLFWLLVLLFMMYAFESDVIGCGMLIIFFSGIYIFGVVMFALMARAVLK